jgi:predicted aspartyl protease
MRRARFIASGAYVPPPDARTIPIVRKGGAPMTSVAIESAPPIEVLIDTGSTGTLALSEPAARQAGLLAPHRRISKAHSVSLGGLSVNRVVTARTVAIGGLALRDVDVQVYTPAANAPAPSGLLGAGLFRRFRMALDLGADRLHLVPPSLMVAVPEPRR